uniref:N-acetyltransferase domain-containing protein n=1 Tax=Anopheles farauti TaxID=69004 RepID=A0A9I3GJA7_9DIPT
MNTPTTANRAHGVLGTPKVSSSKKSLFGKDNDDQSDIGPMTPIRFGSTRKSTRKSNTVLYNITTFRNLFGNESPDSDRSLSPDFARRFTNNGRYELLAVDADKENMAQPFVDEETRSSFTTVPETPSSRLSAEESALLDENNSNSLSILMHSDLNLVEKRSKTLHQTPGVTTRNRSLNKPCQSPNQASLRRTQQQKKASNAPTPDNSSQSPDGAKNVASTAKRTHAKARTSLHFSDIQPIPTRSFYTSSTKENEPPLASLHPISTKSFYSSSSTLEKTGLPHVSPKESQKLPTVSVTSTAKTPRKSALPMRKRSKSISSCAPRLGQRGTVHKIRKQTKKPTLPAKKSPISQTPKRDAVKRRNNRAISGNTKSCPTTPKSTSETQTDQDDETLLRQLKRVSEILHQGQRNLKRARPLSLSMTDLSKRSCLSHETADPSSSEDEGSDSFDEDEEQQEATTKRKFFRSARKSGSVRRVYTHFNSIEIGVRKGGKRKLLSFPRAPKRQCLAFTDERDFNFQSEQLEVDELISKLDTSGSMRSEDASTTTMDDDDDEPIPIQSNVIYLTENEALAGETYPNDEQYEAENDNRIYIVVHDHIVDNNRSQSEPFFAQCEDSRYETPPAAEPTGDAMQDTTIIVQHNVCHTTTISSTEQLYQYHSQCQSEQQAPGSAEQENSNDGYYPLFYPERVKELWREQRRQHAEAPEPSDVRNLLRQQVNQRDRGHSTPSRTHAPQRHGIGRDQYQIDAGQRAYGAVHCRACGLTYSTNEPEEERFHDNFHRTQAKLVFPTTPNEHVVAQVPEWDVTGRIIVVSQTDSAGRHRMQRIRGVLEMVDSELGFSTYGELPDGGCVYVAVARSTVLGVCVVQPLHYANRMICLEGLHGVPIDCYSSELYPARCGISRIWVAPRYRRQGVGRKLMAAIRAHYIFGYVMQYDEIAFGAPTEQGKLFAESITGRKDFLVYV